MEKRPNSDQDSDVRLKKKIKLTNDEKNEKDENQEEDIEFMSLSDCMIVTILSKLDAVDLFNISRCNKRLNQICYDRELWIDVLITSDGDIPNHDNFIQFLKPTTRTLELKRVDIQNNAREVQENDTYTSDQCLNEHFFSELKKAAPNLNTFKINHHILKEPIFALDSFSSTLTVLDLSNTKIEVNQERWNLFSFTYCRLENLKVLNVTGCDWFDPYSLMSLSKCANLEELYMRNCIKVHDFIPYASISARFGFLELKVLDLRECNISNHDLSCFYKLRNLEHLYIQNPNRLLNNEESEYGITDEALIVLSYPAPRPGDILPGNMRIIQNSLIADVANCDKLRKLIMRDYLRITDMGVEVLVSRMDTLEFIDVSGSGCTVETLTRLKNQNPNLAIQFNELIF